MSQILIEMDETVEHEVWHEVGEIVTHQGWHRCFALYCNTCGEVSPYQRDREVVWQAIRAHGVPGQTGTPAECAPAKATAD